jgi:SH3-like domain-containing protein
MRMSVRRHPALLLILTLLAVTPPAARAQTPTPPAPPPAHHTPEHHTPEHHAPEHRASEHPAAEHRAAETKPAEHHATGHHGTAAHPGAGAQPPVVHPQSRPPARQKPATAPAAPAPAPAPAAPAPAPDAAATPDKGSVTGLPLPRFASLRSDDVNLRAGPGTRYPIDWVYKRRDLPVEIEREFDVWRLISDQDGVRGWVNQATLVARRGFVVAGAERTMRSVADDQASPVARLQVGVIGRLRACAAGSDWCEVQVGEYRGWLKRGEIWGVLPGEVVQP